MRYTQIAPNLAKFELKLKLGDSFTYFQLGIQSEICFSLSMYVNQCHDGISSSQIFVQSELKALCDVGNV